MKQREKGFNLSPGRLYQYPNNQARAKIQINRFKKNQDFKDDDSPDIYANMNNKSNIFVKGKLSEKNSTR